MGSRTLRVAVATVVLLAAPPLCHAAEFSLFGVRFGMPREEVGKIWQPLDSGEYYIKEAVLFNVRCEFDHSDRLYEVTFSVPLLENYPAPLVGTAYQGLVAGLWQSPGQTASVRVGRGTAVTTVTNIKLLREYNEHIQQELRQLLRP